MKYSKNDLKAVDVFALILVGAGILLLVVSFCVPSGLYVPPKHEGPEISREHGAKSEGKKKIIEKEIAVACDEDSSGKSDTKVNRCDGYMPARIVRTPINFPMLLLGIVFTSLGAALNIALRKVIANGGDDVPSPCDALASNGQ